MMNRAAAFAFALLFVQCGHAAAQDRVFTLPQPLGTGDTAYLEVKLGAIGPGQEIEITTTGGRTLGVISPHGIRAGHAAGTYTLPLPADAISHGRVAVKLMITRSDAAPRMPNADEVRGVRVVVSEAARP
ncbi:hypothetical protein [Candidatus Nitrotoga sp. M5]|uniref:hypothetical protein n=1 Tax=Candidatus Nitrotoga sp. M5 TaxID=2890409 RepID=UPI001EF16219|nr:hypothetical protein [Candidatus Nitrotoga sp. M5]CAH1385148.1 conserved exported hypothetical protein [Candidatus Nitrotoga sp. M5]